MGQARGSVRVWERGQRRRGGLRSWASGGFCGRACGALLQREEAVGLACLLAGGPQAPLWGGAPQESGSAGQHGGADAGGDMPWPGC